jgi:glycerol-3-phosphate cytidylyltransferase-like family protein
VDTLTVVVNGDELTTSYKRRPVVDEQSRLEVVKACRYVDNAEISNSYEVGVFVEKYVITHIIHGDDWEQKSYLRQIRISEQDLAKQRLELLFLPYTSHVSTSAIIKHCALLAS